MLTMGWLVIMRGLEPASGLLGIGKWAVLNQDRNHKTVACLSSKSEEATSILEAAFFVVNCGPRNFAGYFATLELISISILPS